MSSKFEFNVFLIVILASISIISILMTKNLFKMAVFLTILLDSVLAFFLMFSKSLLFISASDIKMNYEILGIIFILFKFLLFILFMIFLSKHSKENDSMEKDFRPKHYD
ncbi:TPA: hypothetical protein DCW38_00915 [candidate division WOR-3 bacterium]|jgi:hypothetical protein|uniref:Uncharacterized protein n=1 Tax=candidate division WOR-3 bacterium TaxID=2052148 RepID=A0A350H865_UNCW3|nr:hypothetical protein [candidate division WOR-3 bacterium]